MILQGCFSGFCKVKRGISIINSTIYTIHLRSSQITHWDWKVDFFPFVDAYGCCLAVKKHKEMGGHKKLRDRWYIFLFLTDARNHHSAQIHVHHNMAERFQLFLGCWFDDDKGLGTCFSSVFSVQKRTSSRYICCIPFKGWSKSWLVWQTTAKWLP